MKHYKKLKYLQLRWSYKTKIFLNIFLFILLEFKVLCFQQLQMFYSPQTAKPSAPA
jgi:hypothetical protein